MSRIPRLPLLLATLSVSGAARGADDPFGGDEAPAATQDAASAGAELAAGARAYRTFCATCHGVSGRGDGPTAARLDPPPRDFTRGEYKWRTTPTGSLPTDADILRTIDEGAFGTDMPAWKDHLPLATRRALVRHLKTFSDRFAAETPEPPVVLPPAPPPGPEDLKIGRAAWERLKCGECHGDAGEGDGPAAATLADSQGRPIRAYDFTRGFMKAGAAPETVYRTYMTGLAGTPMPSYEQTTTPEERWPLVHYTLSLSQERGVFHWLFAPLKEQP